MEVTKAVVFSSIDSSEIPVYSDDDQCMFERISQTISWVYSVYYMDRVWVRVH